MAWLSGYSKRKKVTLTGGASGAQTSFQLKLVIVHDGDMQSDFDDIRFTQADGTTLIDAWLEVKTDDTSATVWVEFPTTPANTVEQDYYMYYGNGSAASDWDIVATFLFGDDFEDGSIADWTSTGDTEVVTSPVFAGTYAAHVWSTSAAADKMVRYPTIPAGDFIHHIRVRRGETGAQTWIRLYDDLGNTVQIRFSGGDVNWYNNYPNAWQEFDTPTNFSADTWYELILEIQKGTSGAGEMKAYWDGTLVSTDPISFNDFYGTESITYGAGIDQYIDNVFIRKYASGPPTYAFGSEESSTSIPVIMRHYRNMRL